MYAELHRHVKNKAEKQEVDLLQLAVTACLSQCLNLCILLILQDDKLISKYTGGPEIHFLK